MISSKTDEELMIEYQEGSTLAFNVLYGRYKGKAFAFLSKRARSTEEASEIFQQVFLKLHQSRATFNPEYAFTQWLFTICRTSIADFYRSKKNGWFEELNEDLIEAKDEFVAIEAAEHCNYLLAKELSPILQKAVTLRVFNEESYEEIALKLNVSEQNVRQMISRSLKKLKASVITSKDKV